MTNELPRVAIAIGDPAGIGPEIALKAALDPAVRRIARPVLVGDRRAIEAHARACGLAPNFEVVTRFDALRWRDDALAVRSCDHYSAVPFEIARHDAANGVAACDAARIAVAAAIAGEVEAVVAAPQTETSIKAAGIDFDGYPSFVARCTGTPIEQASLMICFEHAGAEMRIAHATLHTSLRHAIDLITIDHVERVVAVVATTLKRIGIAVPRIAVSGLNPHASEEGLFGTEERQIIEPALARCRARGIAVEGPFGADTMFGKTGFDAFVVMTHDQGHIAAKLLAPNRTAGLTIGTPILFSSVAHGSAHDIAGRNQASPAAVIEAIRRLVGAAATRG